MKKTIFSLLMLLGTTAAVAQRVATTVELQRAIAANPAAQITLTTDIDVSPLGKLRETFTGTIDGGEGCNIITGITEPLFDTVEGATFRNITFKDCTIQTDELYHVGLIAANATGGCRFENIKIRNCVVNSNFKPEMTNEELGQYTLFAGELVGGSDGSTFVGCSTDDQSGVYSQSVYLDLLNYIYIGGLVGHSEKDVFERCVNRALVSGDCRVGGLAGWAQKTQVSSCINAGTIMASTDSFADIFAKYKEKGYDPVTMEYDGQTYTLQAFTKDDLQGQYFTDSFYDRLYIGGLFGHMSDGSTMTDCVNLAFLTMGLPLGGLVGKSDYSVIDRCINYGSCKVGYWGYRFFKGGIVGLTYGTTVSNCLNAGNLDFSHNMYGFGSIAGSAYENSKIYNCISTTPCTILASRVSDGDLLDPNTSGNNYYVKPDIEYVERAWERAVTEEQMKNGIVAHWLRQLNISFWKSESCTWRQNIGEDDYPVLDPTHKIVTISDVDMPTISSSKDMFDFFNEVGNGHNVYAMRRLACDIDMSKYPLSIGLPANPFRGIFDGAGHTIYNCNYRQTVGGGNGVFGTVGNGAEIYNLILSDDCTVTNTHNDDGAAGIVGQVVGSGKPAYIIIDGCGNYASILGKSYAGGILGKVDCDDNVKVCVTNCYNVGEIKTTNGNSALLCGYMKNSGVVSNCWSYGQLRTGTENVLPYKVDSKDGLYYHFVGYDNTLDISKSYTFGSEEKVDGWHHSKLQTGVFEYPSVMLTHGTFTYLLNGEKNDPETNTWQQNMGGYPVPGNKGLYHTREVTSQYGTICLPYTQQSNDEIQYYTFASVESDEGTVSLHFESTTEVAAGKPALFRVKTTGTYNFDDVNKDYFFYIYDTDQTGWNMRGTFEQKVFEGEDAKNIYYVSNGEIKNAKKTTIAPYRAYIEGPSIDALTGNSGQAKAIRFVLEDEDGEITVIDSPDLDSLPRREGWGGASYSLMGTEVNSKYRGIVIQNGKKLIYK